MQQAPMQSPMSTSDPREDSGRMNGIIMGIIYFVMFVPGTGVILLSILTNKTRVKRGPTQLLVVYLMFLGVFLLREIMALIFLLGFATDAFATPVADSVYNYWIPSLCVILEFVAIVQLMSLWNTIIHRVTNKHIIDRTLNLFAAFALVCLCIVSLVALIVLRPTGAAGGNNPRLFEAATYRIIFFTATLVATIFLIVCLSTLAARVRKHADKAEINDLELRSFTNRVRGFAFAACVALIIRASLDIAVAVLRPDVEIVLRVLEMILHALPELIIVYTFIGISWRRVFSATILVESSASSELS